MFTPVPRLRIASRRFNLRVTEGASKRIPRHSENGLVILQVGARTHTCEMHPLGAQFDSSSIRSDAAALSF